MASEPLTGVGGKTGWKNVTLFLLTACVIVICGLIVFPFLTASVGAIVLAVVTQRPYEWLVRKLRKPTLAAAVALLLVILSIIGPGFMLIRGLGKQALAAASLVRDGVPQRKLAELVAKHPSIASRLETAAVGIDLEQATQKSASYLGARLAGILGNSVSSLIQLVLMLVVLFFLYRDGALALSALRSLLPLTDSETDRLLERITGTIYATALGRFSVATVQGCLAGLAFWILRVPGAGLWAAVTALLALVPAFGAFLVWVPIVIYLILTGHWVKAALLAGWGAVVVSTIDNFLYPILVGSRLQQHTVAILLSVLGGIAVFGLSGVILGPIVFTVARTLLEIWKERTADEVHLAR
jgi:predicted PurR-regulated permease PerM